MTIALISLFALGYLLITLEESVGVNKTATALLTGVVCWAVVALNQPDTETTSHALAEHLTDIAEILFFLLGAMTIVELIDAHDGFTLITDRIASRNTRTLLWIISFLAFFLSALLDNLTTAIVTVSVSRKLIQNAVQRRTVAAMIVVAANAGGAWSPIGDVTTTMLWIGGQVTTANIITRLFVPSLVAMLVPLLVLTFQFRADEETFEASANEQSEGVGGPD